MKKKLSIVLAIALIMSTLTGTMIGAAAGDVPTASFSPSGTTVPIDTKLEVKFPGQQLRTNGQQVYTISRNTSGAIEKTEVTVTQASYTDSLILTPPSNLQYGTTYTISFPDKAFMVGNPNGVESSPLSWSFTTVSQPTTALTATFSPTNGSTGVNTSARPVITFNRNVKLNPSVTNGGITLRKTSNGAAVPISVSASSNQVTIVPSYSLEEGASYYVEIASNGIYDAQAPQLYYAGISGSSYWYFQTVANDKTAPVLQSSTMYNNTVIRLLYNEALNSSYNLPTSNFTVTVNGETRRLNYVTVSGDSVYVYLETGIAVGQDVKISYSGYSQGIRDLAGNAAASFPSRAVTNGIDSVMPKPKDTSYATSNTVTLYFSDSLKSPSSYAYQQFTVTADGNNKPVSSISQSGSVVTLYLSSSISNGEVVKVSYTPGSYPLQDYRGMDIPAFSDFYVRNTYDTVAPVFKQAEGSGNKIIMTYNELLRTSPTPMKSQFSVLVNNAPVYVTAVEVVSNQVILTLASSFTKDQNVTLSYVSGYGGIADSNGNLAGYVNLQPVTYSAVAEGVRSISVTGDTLTIVYNSTLRASSYVPVNQFYIVVDKVNRGVQSATINGNTVTLKLASAVSVGQVVTLSYLTGAAPLYDSAGNILKSFNNMPVQNITGGQTTGTNVGQTGQPDYLTTMSNAELGVGGYILNTNTAQTSGSRSHSGIGMNRYTIDTTKLQAAFKYLTDNNVVTRRVVFEVPSTEKAAEVAVPVSALMDMYSKGKTGSFAVKYNKVMYELPIEKIPFTEISRALNVNSLTSAYLNIQLDPLTQSQLPTLNYSNGVSTTPIADPMQIYVSSYNGTNLNNTVDVSHTGQIYYRTVNTSANNQVSLVKYNLTSRTASFVPSKVTNGSSLLIFSGKVNGNSVIGPAAGYSYFNDTAKHWARNDISELAGKLIIDGHSGAKFDPDKNITRAEFATFIAKGLGLEQDVTTAKRFPDVSSGTTGAYIGAAAKAGIINGNADGTFKPNSNITREQMALMMVRAMEYAGYNTSMNGANTATLTRFKDAAKIQAKDTVAKAVKEGIIQGVSATSFQPKGNATRAQAAVMLKRVLDKLNYI